MGNQGFKGKQCKKQTKKMFASWEEGASFGITDCSYTLTRDMLWELHMWASLCLKPKSHNFPCLSSGALKAIFCKLCWRKLHCLEVMSEAIVLDKHSGPNKNRRQTRWVWSRRKHLANDNVGASGRHQINEISEDERPNLDSSELVGYCILSLSLLLTHGFLFFNYCHQVILLQEWGL